MKYPIVKTDVYPTRYTAYDKPDHWAVFEPVAGMFRSCLSSNPPRPVGTLGCTSGLAGELAVLTTSKGGHVTVWGSREMGPVHADVYHPFLRDSSLVKHVIGRPLEEVMVRAEKVLEKADRLRDEVAADDWVLVDSYGNERVMTLDDIALLFTDKLPRRGSVHPLRQGRRVERRARAPESS